MLGKKLSANQIGKHGKSQELQENFKGNNRRFWTEIRGMKGERRKKIIAKKRGQNSNRNKRNNENMERMLYKKTTAYGNIEIHQEEVMRTIKSGKSGLIMAQSQKC